MLFRPLAVVLCISLAWLAGCGGGTVTTVDGKVTLDGNPLPNAVVTFHGTNEVGGFGGSNATGIYQLQAQDEKAGVKPGEYKVTVSATELRDPSATASTITGPHAMEESSKLLTPELYATPATTPLKVTVKEGKNTIPLEVKSK
jgi:hypothetical protein